MKHFEFEAVITGYKIVTRGNETPFRESLCCNNINQLFTVKENFNELLNLTSFTPLLIVRHAYMQCVLGKRFHN